MRVREDVAALLREGLTDMAVAARLGVAASGVGRARAALGIPPHRRGRPAAPSAEALFRARTTPAAGGHLHWAGYRTADGVPVARWRGRGLGARGVAFRIRYGRDPVGYVKAGCGDDECVHPGHVEDRPMRERNQAAYRAIFGDPP
ncbi:hypothetical protein [Streptomyces sp. NPDC050504]|uniref:hypothetical protein n=1 Tax=Streptomyces sp. NPDC050504 TaxID=3365618 RepID=UPI0037958621